MKTLLIIFLIIFLPPISEKQTLLDNSHVALEQKQTEKISISKNGEIAFLFKPIHGIHINTNPLFELKLEKNSVFEIVGKTRFQKTESEYLDVVKPVEFSFKAKKGTRPGKQTLAGKLNYFYCSDIDGWCNRFSQPINVTIEVVP